MRIGIDIRSILKKKTGIGYYTFNLINNLAKIDKESSYFLYADIGFFSRSKKLPLLPGENFKYIINRLKLNPHFFLKDLDIFHTSSYDLPKPKNSKLILVVHDVIHKACPIGLLPDTIKFVAERIKNILPLADRVIVPSLVTKNDLLRFYGVEENKIRLIYPGINVPFDVDGHKLLNNRDLFRKKYNINFPFILFVGTIEPRKNVRGLVMAFKTLKQMVNLEHKLVIVGMKGRLCEDVFELVEDLNLKNDIIFTDYIPREDLDYFYRFADIFVYPSFYEGAGLPVLEAISYGLPVITSKSSAMSEIAGEAVISIDPNNYEEIAQAILNLINDDNLKEELRQRGLKRATELSWENTAIKTLEIFRELV